MFDKNLRFFVKANEQRHPVLTMMARMVQDAMLAGFDPSHTNSYVLHTLGRTKETTIYPVMPFGVEEGRRGERCPSSPTSAPTSSVLDVEEGHRTKTWQRWNPNNSWQDKKNPNMITNQKNVNIPGTQTTPKAKRPWNPNHPEMMRLQTWSQSQNHNIPGIMYRAIWTTKNQKTQIPKAGFGVCTRVFLPRVASPGSHTGGSTRRCPWKPSSCDHRCSQRHRAVFLLGAQHFEVLSTRLPDVIVFFLLARSRPLWPPPRNYRLTFAKVNNERPYEAPNISNMASMETFPRGPNVADVAQEGRRIHIEPKANSVRQRKRK